MKLSKAIEILTDIVTYVKPGDPPDEHDAIKLGIEALKHINHNRLINNHPDQKLLPGETEE